MTLFDQKTRGIEALRAGDRPEASRLLRLAVQHDPNDASAWVWLSNVVDTDEEKRLCIRNAYQLNPGNPHIHQLWEEIMRDQADDVKAAAEWAASENVVKRTVAQSSSRQERVAAARETANRAAEKLQVAEQVAPKTGEQTAETNTAEQAVKQAARELELAQQAVEQAAEQLKVAEQAAEQAARKLEAAKQVAEDKA